MSYVLWGYSYTCRMYCVIQLYMSYELCDTIIHVVRIVGDAVIHVVCIVYCEGYSYTCRMYFGIHLHMYYVLWDTVIHVVCSVGIHLYM